ncbi:MAG: hypothetical protein JO312_24455, partial [Hyphomicrobiales bacterium]|nr:hypothetical protein [Hyphomicrobiales bacterium]
MNRRQLFLSTAKAALLAAFGSWLPSKASAQASAAAAPTEGVPAPVVTFGGESAPYGTRTIPGYSLPAPRAPFEGTIGFNAAQSSQWWPRLTVPPKGA